jgi:hypothetical protein
VTARQRRRKDARPRRAPSPASLPFDIDLTRDDLFCVTFPGCDHPAHALGVMAVMLSVGARGLDAPPVLMPCGCTVVIEGFADLQSPTG